MSIAHLWQQVPSPAPSPTVERIVVEMAERSSGVGGWTAALIAGCAAILAAGLTAVLTHTFTHKREHRMWVRQRVFDAIKDLEVSFNQIKAENFGPPTILAHSNVTVSQLAQLLKEYDWDAFNNLISSYDQALTELEMLDADLEIEMEVVRTRNCVRAYTHESKRFAPDHFPEGMDVVDLFQRRAGGSRMHWIRRHNNLRDQVVQSYIADKKPASTRNPRNKDMPRQRRSK